MPQHIKFLGRCGNGLLGVLSLIGTLASLSNGQFSAMVFGALVLCLSIFNVYVIEKAAASTTEEEWLKAELRKAEIRQKLASLQAAR